MHLAIERGNELFVINALALIGIRLFALNSKRVWQTANQSYFHPRIPDRTNLFLWKIHRSPNFFFMREAFILANVSPLLKFYFLIIPAKTLGKLKSCFMNKRLLILPALLHFFQLYLNAQVTPPCPVPPPPGAESCASTCVYCDFDGYMGTNSGTPSGGNIVCGQISIHNDQWFGFVAGTESITINVATENCEDGNGLQAAFFDNCQADALVCNSGSSGGAGQPLTLTYSGFVPGQTYYLMIDGWTGDVCDYEIELLDGSITPPAPGAPTAPSGPTKVCPGATVVYTIPEVDGAGYYNWTAPAGSQINGGSSNVTFPAPQGTEVTITFGNVGGNVCVRVGNACFQPQIVCLPVTNTPIPFTQKPKVVVCSNDLPYFWDEQPYTIINTAGTFNLTSTPYDSYLGCDSIIKQTIEVKPPTTTNIGFKYICDGECFEINGNSYCNSGGPFTEVLESFLGCDSLVQFSVVKVPAVAVIGGVQSINCDSPVLTLNSNGSTNVPSATYTWTNVSWTQIGTQTTQNVSTVGTYHLIVSNNFGTASCKDTATVVVPGNTTPPGASAIGGNVTCASSSAVLQGSSPTGGVTFQWSGPGITPANQNQQNPTVMATGTYILTVENPVNGCTSTATVQVTGDLTPPTASAVGDTITCLQSSVTVNSTTDAATAAYFWTGPGINAGNQTVADPVVLQSGTYNVTITNSANGCTNTASASVVLNTGIPTASAGADQTITCLLPSVTLNGSGSAGGGAPVNFVWTGIGITPANQNSPTPTVNQADTYILTVTNPANGCFKKDTVIIGANIAVPNADAGADQTITCTSPTVPIGGSGSSQGAIFTATWTGPGINGTNQNQYNPTVNVSGVYTLTILNTTNGCSSTEDVSVNINTTPPTVSAGLDQILTCTSPNGIILNGSGTPAGITYLWSGLGIGANNETQPNPTVTVPDTYTLQVTNPANGCTATDQVVVTQDANVPAANAGPDLGLNCTVSSVNIDASGTASGPGITYQWAGPGISGINATVQSPTNITVPGTYSLTVTNTNNNCLNTDIVVIEIDTVAPTASAGSDLVLNCYNNATDTLNASASSSGANFTLLWSGPAITTANQNDLMPIVNVPGIYSLTVTNTDNNCTATAQVDVVNDVTPPTADAGADKTIDCVVTSVAIGGNSSTGPDFTYLWTGPGITPANANLAQPVVNVNGNYSLVVTYTVNGCTASSDVLVNTNAVYPTASAGADGLLTCAQPAATLNGSGSSSGANIQIAWSGPDITPANQGQVSPNVTQPGVYILTITNTSNSCVSKDTALVDENKITPVASAGQDWMLDCQTTSVVLDGSLSDTGATIVYLWTGAGINAGNQNEQSPAVSQFGNYTLLVTNTANGCTAQDAIFVDQNITPPVASAGGDFVLTCLQNSQAIDGSASSVGPDFTYLWQGPDINTNNFDLQNPVVSDSGTYILIVTNMQNHCTATDNVYVAKDGDFPVTEAGADQTLTCQKDTLQLDGSQSQTGPGILYSWSGPGIVAGQANSISPNVFLSGTYTLTVTNTNNGCSETDVVNVEEDFILPTVNAGADLILTCANSTTGVTLNSDASSSGPGFTLQWSGPGITPANQNLPNPTVLVVGTYTLVITNTINGCTHSDEVVVLQDQDLPTANAGADQTLTCAVLTVVLDGSASSSPSGAIQYQWSGPGIAGNQGEPMPTVALSGSYTLTVFNPISGCQASDNVEVLLDNQPPTVLVTTDTITCDEPQGTITVTSSLPGSSFEWSGPSIDQGNMNDDIVQVIEPGSYNVIVTAPNGCTKTASLTVGVDADFPDGAAEGAELDCNNSGIATINGQVNTPGATFSWTGPNGFTSNTLSATVTQPGTYTFTIVSPNGCPRPIPVDVTANFVKPLVNAFVDELLDCNTTSLTINTVGTSIGPIYTYAWSTSGGNIVSGANGLSPVVNEAGQYNFVVSNNINGCKDSVTVLVENDPIVPTAFDLLVQDIRCFGEDNGVITVNSIIGGTKPFTFSLDGGTGTPSNQYTGLTAGNYTLLLEDANGCVLDTTVSISEPSQLLVELGDDVTVQLGEEATVTAQIANETPLQSITWNYAPNCDSLAAQCLEFTYLPLQSYRHEITLLDTNGCVARDRVNVIVRKDRLVYVPNVFNPSSSDPLNGLLMIQGGTGVVKVHQWQIYDRWGDAVFSVKDFLPNDPAYAWDGKINGDDGHAAVYVWFAEIEFLDGQIELFEGDVTIMR